MAGAAWVVAVEECGKNGVAPPKAMAVTQSSTALIKRDPSAGIDLNYTIVVEHCANCSSHNMHTRHDANKYIFFGQQRKQLIILTCVRSRKVHD